MNASKDASGGLPVSAGPSISVIICTWNRCRLLSETLETVRAQRVASGSRIEVLVVDNNSSDGTEEVVRRFQGDWLLGQLVYLREPRQGKQFALNRGIAHSTGDVLAFTDDDVILPHDWLEAIREAFREPTAQLIGGKTQLLWPGGASPAWFRQSMLAVVAGVDLGDRRLCPPPSDYAPAGTNLVARRIVFDRIGVFSESHFRHMDYEFGMRATRLGINVEYEPGLVVATPVPLEVINKRYFRRWYFKLGIAASMDGADGVRRLLGVPRWIWRQVLSDAVSVAWMRLRGRTDESFETEVRIAQLIGRVACSWHRTLWPRQHVQWVERRSQKRGATFG